MSTEKVKFLSTAEAAEYLGLSKSTLEIWRHRGTGPKFCKMGRAIRYRDCDLDGFAEISTMQKTSSRDTKSRVLGMKRQ